MRDERHRRSAKIALSRLRPIAIMYEGDLYELASFMLKACVAKDKGTGATSRPTVHGVASAFLRHADLSLETIEDVIERRGIDPSGPTVDPKALGSQTKQLARHDGGTPCAE